MRILCVSSFFREQGGGVAHMAHLLARELARMPGMEVTLAAHSGDAARPADGAEEHGAEEPYARMTIRATNWFEQRLGVPLLLPHPGDVMALTKAARAADVLIVHDSVYLANLAALNAASPGAVTIVVKHTGEVRFGSRIGQLAFGIFSRGLEPAAVRRADALAFVTQAKLDNSRPIAGPRRVVIPNGIDTDIFAPNAGAARDGSLLFVGRFVPKKGIAIIREMARAMPDRRFVLAGYGGDDPRQWGLANVTVHWQPAPADIARLLSACAAAILPGETEGTPLVALEALACEAPVVIGHFGKAPDPALDAQMAAIPVDVDDPVRTAQAWCAALDAAIASSRPDRAIILRDYSAQRMARDYHALIAQIAADKA